MDELILRGLGGGGLVSTREAEAAGIDRRELADAARRGRVLRVARGWYVMDPTVGREEIHRWRAAAALLTAPQRCASHHTGLILRGLPTFRAPLSTIQLVAPRVPRRIAPGIVIRPRATMVVEHVRVGSREVPILPVATCIVQSGTTGCAESALISADAALAAGSTTRRDLDLAVADAAGHRGIREVRRVLAWADGRHESPGESRLACSLHRLGHAYEPQVWIGNDRVDALLTAAPVVMEFDGALKYATRDDLIREKRREDRIRARGYQFVRRVWDDVGDLAALERAILAAIQRTR